MTGENYLFQKSEVSVERISVCNAIKKLVEHGLLCLPYSDANDVIDLLPQQQRNNQQLCLIPRQNDILMPSETNMMS